MSDLSTLKQYYKLADQLIEKVSKEDIAECARLLAMNVAHYQSKYGELPLDETLANWSPFLKFRYWHRAALRSLQQPS
jgi:hypothetical protein